MIARLRGFLLEPLELFWKNRYMLLQTTRNDIVSRYAGSALGVVWTVVYPIVLLSIYAVVFVYIFKIRFATMTSNEYVALIFCGLVPFLGFSEAISLATGSVVGNSGLVKNTLFPVEFIPVKATLSGLGTQVVGTVFLIGLSVYLRKISPWTLLLPTIFMAQLSFMLGLGWILSALNVYFRDFQTMVPLTMVMFMMITPIAYTVDMIPDALRPFLGINPLYYIVVSHQEVLINGCWPRGSVFLVLLIMAFVFFYSGYWFFSRIKNAFIDNV